VPLSPTSSRSVFLELDFAERDTDFTTAATTEATAGTILTGAALTYDGATVVEVLLYAVAWRISVVNNSAVIVLFEDGSAIGQVVQALNTVAAINVDSIVAKRRLTPTAGAHTYSWRAFVIGTGTLTIEAGPGGAGLYTPTYMQIVRVAR